MPPPAAHAPRTAAAATGEPEAEPACVVVHDPAAAGALDALQGHDPEEVKRRWSFDEAPAPPRFSAQHRAFADAVAARGVRVVALADLVGDDPGARRALAANPNHVYTRDAAITFPWAPDVFVAGAMRAPVRRGEPPVLELALSRLGLRRVAAASDGAFLEGGDVVPLALDGRRVLVAGFGPRSSEDGIGLLAATTIPDLADEVLAVELADWRINLDGVIVAAAPDVALVQPESIVRGVRIDAHGAAPVDVLAALREAGMRLIEVTPDEAVEEGCNVLCLGGRRVVCYAHNSRVLDELRRRDVEPVAVPGDELVKGTGGPRCMSRPVYRA